MQRVRLLVSARAYQPANNIFLSQQTSISRTYQSRNQPAKKLIASSMHSNPNPSEVSGLEPGSWIWIFKYLYVRSYHCLDESFFNKKVGRQPVTMALFGLPHIRLVRFVFSAKTMFFSHNNSAGTAASFSQDSDQGHIRMRAPWSVASSHYFLLFYKSCSYSSLFFSLFWRTFRLLIQGHAYLAFAYKYI